MSYLDEILKKQTTMGCSQEEDICCYCGERGTDKIALPNIFSGWSRSCVTQNVKEMGKVKRRVSIF